MKQEPYPLTVDFFRISRYNLPPKIVQYAEKEALKESIRRENAQEGMEGV